jgi:hypothetical protein
MECISYVVEARVAIVKLRDVCDVGRHRLAVGMLLGVVMTVLVATSIMYAVRGQHEPIMSWMPQS